THGTGCTLSAAIAALLALGRLLEEAVAEAKAYLTRALMSAPPLGHGHGPLNHGA
ncbi:MAG: bifunctional hydroxymethylpyrimidine kinase/phosphomethylpyrimidine kinase, partial [Meiothermus sp.]|uniref:bifunctional hydroxymethylpyrimidine kinase/phosphomethylpyrimidine kinase n=1 Tax=Meiothermus sp. TaxID=1955249 RepID=UPI0028CC31CF